MARLFQGALFLTLGPAEWGVRSQAHLGPAGVLRRPQARMEEERPSSVEVCPLFSLITMALKMIWAQTTVLAHSVVCSFRGLITLLQLL